MDIKTITPMIQKKLSQNGKNISFGKISAKLTKMFPSGITTKKAPGELMTRNPELYRASRYS